MQCSMSTRNLMNLMTGMPEMSAETGKQRRKPAKDPSDLNIWVTKKM